MNFRWKNGLVFWSASMTVEYSKRFRLYRGVNCTTPLGLYKLYFTPFFEGEGRGVWGWNFLSPAPADMVYHDSISPFYRHLFLHFVGSGCIANSLHLFSPLLNQWHHEHKYRSGCGWGQGRVAKGWKLSGNFGNFPWKVSGIFNRLGILGILGIFNIILHGKYLIFLR